MAAHDNSQYMPRRSSRKTTSNLTCRERVWYWIHNLQNDALSNISPKTLVRRSAFGAMLRPGQVCKRFSDLQPAKPVTGEHLSCEPGLQKRLAISEYACSASPTHDQDLESPNMYRAPSIYVPSSLSVAFDEDKSLTESSDLSQSLRRWQREVYTMQTKVHARFASATRKEASPHIDKSTAVRIRKKASPRIDEATTTRIHKWIADLPATPTRPPVRRPRGRKVAVCKSQFIKFPPWLDAIRRAIDMLEGREVALEANLASVIAGLDKIRSEIVAKGGYEIASDIPIPKLRAWLHCVDEIRDATVALQGRGTSVNDSSISRLCAWMNEWKKACGR